MTQPSSENLAVQLEHDGFTQLAKRARQDEFHDYKSPHEMPEHVLVDALRSLRLPAADRLARRVIEGEFDATMEESDAWAASPEGQETMRMLFEDNP